MQVSRTLQFAYDHVLQSDVGVCKIYIAKDNELHEEEFFLRRK
jgi:hypothetical protein